MAEVYKWCNDIVAHLPGVVRAVRAEGEQRAATARALLAAHRDTGNARIEVEHGDTDTVISLVDEAAMSIEYGHTATDGTPVQGLHIITRIS